MTCPREGMETTDLSLLFVLESEGPVCSVGTLQGAGQVWEECRLWILSFPGLNLGSAR